MANILLLTPQLPYPPRSGASLRNWNIIRGVAAEHTVSLLSFREENQNSAKEATQPMHDLCQQVRTVTVPERSTNARLMHLIRSTKPDMAHRLNTVTFTSALREMLTADRYDIVQIEGIELAYTIPDIRKYSPHSKIVFDNHNAETALQKRTAEIDQRSLKKLPKALYSQIQTTRLSDYERWACIEADAVTVVSESDRREILTLIPEYDQDSIRVIPNCIDVRRTTSEVSPHSFDVTFTGKMDYRPNVDAITWFVNEIWQKVRAVRPQATLAIVGQKPTADVQALENQQGVKVTGWVEEINPYLNGTKIAIMPLRMGSGTRLKMLEAMALERPIVSTSIGAEGYPVVDDQHLFIANDTQKFADAITHLLQNPSERARLGRNAREFALNYDWRSVIANFYWVYDEILAD